MNADNLLLWLSANGSGTWDRYRAAIDELAPAASDDGEDDRPARSWPLHHRAQMNLERLGHAEFFRPEFEAGWRVVPPTLACGESNNGAAGILCGARTRLLLAKIESAADLVAEHTSQTECPARIRLSAQGIRELEHSAGKIGLRVQRDASRALLAAIPAADEGQYRTPAELPFGNDWQAEQFSCATLGWEMVEPRAARAASFGLFRYSVYSRRHHFLQNRSQTFSVPGQVGKYIALKRARRHVLRYDPESQRLRVPMSCRPPSLIERALVLCSGLVPELDHGDLVYSSVSLPAANATRDLLRQ